MTTERTIRALIESNLERFAVMGTPRRQHDVERYLRYREALTPAEQALLDDLLRRGSHPAAAMETVEIEAGRLQPHGSEYAEEPVARK